MTATSTAPVGYDTKSADYWAQSRPEILEFIPTGCGRALDVGCGSGSFGALLKRERGIEVWGVEPFPSAAAQAALVLDSVCQTRFNKGDINLPSGYFDCITFNDVLEHLEHPEEALRLSIGLLSPNGLVVASIPNIRCLPFLWQLAVRGRWDYTEWGTLDKTHLRFFTRSSIEKMFRGEGFEIERIEGIHPYQGNPNASRALWTAYELANLLCIGRLSDLKYLQFVVTARIRR